MNALLAELEALAKNLGPVASAVLAALLIIGGLLVIFNPNFLAWIVGLFLILVGHCGSGRDLCAPPAFQLVAIRIFFTTTTN